MAVAANDKDHFKNRLHAHVKELKARIAGRDATWERDITKQAQELAEKRFEVEPLLKELAKLKAEKARLETAITDKESEIVEQMTGRKSQDVSAAPRTRSNYYGRNEEEDTDEFGRYPGVAKDIMRRQAAHEVEVLKEAHPVASKLKALDTRCELAVDKIMFAASHNQMGEIWRDVCVDFGMITETNDRQPRKVNTNRKSNKETVTA